MRRRAENLVWPKVPREGNHAGRIAHVAKGASELIDSFRILFAIEAPIEHLAVVLAAFFNQNLHMMQHLDWPLIICRIPEFQNCVIRSSHGVCIQYCRAPRVAVQEVIHWAAGCGSELVMPGETCHHELMDIRYPRPLLLGDTVGVTSPSRGVDQQLLGRLNFAAQHLRERGFLVNIGDCMDGARHVSASAEERAGELMRMLLDPQIQAVIPPWGGETAIDVIPHLDFEALAKAEPTWFIGYSDISTLLTPITLLSGMATIHGSNLLDTPYKVPEPLRSWMDIASMPAGSSFSQSSPGVYRVNDWDPWQSNPTVTEHSWNGAGTWERLDHGQGTVDVTGRLIGGCVETLVNLAGTPYLDTKSFRGSANAPLIVYIEASGAEATMICRHLHGMRLAGFFDNANAILVGRTGAPDSATLTQAEAVVDALGMLNVPIIGNVECGHVPPQLPIVNGALGHLVSDGEREFLEQRLL